MPPRVLLVLALLAWTSAAGARAQSVVHELDGPSDAVLFGTAVDFAGDVDADGTSDVIVGDWLDSIYDGRAQVDSGAEGGLVQDIVGEQFGDRLGFSVSGAGDWNGDGRADLHVDVPGSTLLLVLPILSDADGYASLPLPVPASPALVGRTFYLQAVWQWGGACGMPLPGLSSSNGLALTVQ